MLIELILAAMAAANPADRVEELKQWKAQCSDADIDVRTAYVEAAVASGDATIARTCTRLAIESDNADVRNLGLRAAIASTEQVTFAVAPPPAYAAALEKAAGDEDAIKAVEEQYARSLRYWDMVRGGVPFIIDKASVENGTSRWNPTVYQVREAWAQPATIVGDTVSWSGYMSTNARCTLKTSLNDEAQLVGSLRCSDDLPYPVKAQVF